MRPYLVDCQSHLWPPATLARLAARAADPVLLHEGESTVVRMGPWRRKVLPGHSDVAAKLAAMDAAGIEWTALSVNDPGPEWFGAAGPEVAAEMNDYIADVVRQHPTRFFGVCVLPFPDVPACLAELDRCLDPLGMKGVLLYTNLAGRFPDDPAFAPVIDRLAERHVPTLLHPPLPLTAPLLAEYELISGLGNMFDNTLALARLILSGLFDRHPHFPLVCPHLGGTLPYVVGRLDHQMTVLGRGPRTLKHRPSAYLKRVYLDVVSPLPQAIRFAYEFSGPEKLLYASDHPWVAPDLIAECVRGLNLPPADERAIFSDNARRLFGLPG